MLLMALLYQVFIRRTDYSEAVQVAWSVVLIAGGLCSREAFSCT
jgi:hypothetical protein